MGMEKIDEEQERLEKERIEKQRMENKLFPNNALFIIPSWGDLLGYPTLGMYAHHQVSRIDTDVVIFLSGYDYSIETTKGTIYYLFGLGYYFLKFELESGKYITDNRILTGLILADFVYDHIATSKNVTLIEDRDVIIAEKVIKVPIDLSYKSENRLTFIKGVLMRNVFIPHKDIFLEMMEKIRKIDTYQIVKNGHMLLSTHWDFYNQILVSDKMRANFDMSYLNSVAGLNGIVFEADQLLQKTLSPTNLTIIKGNVDFLNNVYSNLEFDPMYLFSIFEKASISLRSSRTHIPSSQIYSVPKKTSKHSIFASAEDRVEQFINWPLQFKRKTKKEPPIIPKKIEEPTYMQQDNIHSSDVRSLKATQYKQEKFELKQLKSERVEVKPLPYAPVADIKQILLYLKKVIEENYDMLSIGQAFEIARDRMRQIGISSTVTQQKKIWEMSKYANIYLKKRSALGLPVKEKQELIQKLDEWLFETEEEARKERERLERARLEKERKKREERERIEREKREKERKERERLEKDKLEKERQLLEEKKKEMEKLEKIKEQREQVRQEQERLAQEQLEREQLEKIERERQEKIRLEKERMEKERKEREAIEKERRELERLKRERKGKEKLAKQKAKRQKKLDKQKKKIEKKKQKEQERLKNL
jgi:hypothetical protein